MSNELTVTERAERVLKFSETRNKLAAMAAKSVDLVEITNAAGYQQVHTARMDLKSTRVEITKRGKEARDDANAFAKAVIAKEKELVAIIEPEESRLQSLQDAWDAAREAERQANAAAERARIEEIQTRIIAIRSAPASYVAHCAADLAEDIAHLEAMVIGEDFAEFQQQAEAAKAESLAKLRDMHAAAVQREAEEAERQRQAKAEAERLAAERAELERIRAEQEAAAMVERERIAAERAEQEKAAAVERARLATEREAQEAEMRAEREKLAQERAEADRIAAERRADEERKAAEERAKIEAERKAAEQAKREAEAAARQREIESATIETAAAEALGLLRELAPGHIVTLKLESALSREVMA